MRFSTYASPYYGLTGGDDGGDASARFKFQISVNMDAARHQPTRYVNLFFSQDDGERYIVQRVIPDVTSKYLYVIMDAPHVWVFRGDAQNPPEPISVSSLPRRIRRALREGPNWSDSEVKQAVQEAGYGLYTVNVAEPDAGFEWIPESTEEWVYDRALKQLSKINKKLRAHCPGWELRLGNFFELPHYVVGYHAFNNLTLCLYYHERCKASVQLTATPNQPQVEISSMTEQDVEGRKFSRFLRACVVLLASKMELMVDDDFEPVARLYSLALDPASVWLLSDYHVEYNPEFQRFIDAGPPLSYRRVQEYMTTQHKSVKVTVFLDRQSVKRAKQLIRQLTQGEEAQRLGCVVLEPPDVSEPSVKRRRVSA